MTKRLMSEYRGDAPEDPDHHFNVNLVSIEFNQDFWHSDDFASVRAHGTRALTHMHIITICDRLNDRLIAIGFYDGCRTGDTP